MFHVKRLYILFITFILIILLYFSNVSKNILKDPELENLYHIPYPIITKFENPVNISPDKIAIVIVLAEEASRRYYQIAIDSVECYAKAHGYQFILTRDNIWGCNYLRDKFFRRHCVISKILPKYKAVLHLDADIGVVNPKRKIEEFMDSNFDIIFHDRHFSPEIGMASYLVWNTNYSRNFLEEFSNYEKKLPEGSYHGTDNGAIHIFLAEKLFPHKTIELEFCRRAWRNSHNLADLFAYTSCIRAIFGGATDFGKIRILKKGTGYVRDNWLTSGIWSPERDFMFHGWKMNQLTEIPPGPLKPVQMDCWFWHNPFEGDFHMDKCGLGNTTWNHNKKLIGTRESVEYELRKYEVKTSLKRIELLRGLYDLVLNTNFNWRRLFQPNSAFL